MVGKEQLNKRQSFNDVNQIIQSTPKSNRRLLPRYLAWAHLTIVMVHRYVHRKLAITIGI